MIMQQEIGILQQVLKDYLHVEEVRERDMRWHHRSDRTYSQWEYLELRTRLKELLGMFTDDVLVDD